MKLVAKITAVAAVLGLPLAAYAAVQHSGNHESEAAEAAEHANAPKPKISEAQARQIALRVAKGKIAEAEFENEGGGWRWSFDISENGKTHEVGVDAMTGKIVEDSWEEAGDND